MGVEKASAGVLTPRLRRVYGIPRRPARAEGSVSLLALVLVCLSIVASMFLYDMAAVFRVRGEAQSAADAAAKAAGLELTPLFGVGTDPASAAASYAAANGAELVGLSLSRPGSMAAVTVTVRKRARTRFIPAGRGGFSVTATARCYLDPLGALREGGPGR
jgi:uncharacterized membrane protein